MAYTTVLSCAHAVSDGLGTSSALMNCPLSWTWHFLEIGAWEGCSRPLKPV